eukprot:CAMPEP_0178381648 /NCGR_PEP_ID=MMETSP0689_2-20121128/6095_1 /TAXON_ID=160604 /ORGANISM="Amphidinium massartii, Strain CS-259" /LENGTH=337 /DNA_ID=CAMNT_0020001845 /DNA_START=223 /DNA_END=1232 /DNA_ORIENTATION=-
MSMAAGTPAPSYVSISDMHLTEDEFARVLKRIGLTEEDVPAPNADVLFKVHRCFVTHVPFENITVMEKDLVSLDLRDITDKICGTDGSSTRGGYCFELNKLLAAVLIRLGFEVDARGGRVWLDDGVTWRNPTRALVTHLCLLVRVPDQEIYLCDVGFGRVAPMEPIALNEANGEPSMNGHCRVRLAREMQRSRLGFEHEVVTLWYEQPKPNSTEQQWFRGYSFVLCQDFDFLDAVPHNSNVCGYFESPFTQRLWCEKRTEDEHVRILGTTLLRNATPSSAASATTKEIESGAELRELMLTNFQIELPQDFCDTMHALGASKEACQKWQHLLLARSLR